MAQIIDLGKLRFNFAGSYSSATTYEVNDCVRFGGNVYVYINMNAAANVQPTTTSHWALMLEGINFTGDYSPSTQYAVADVAAFGGILYSAIEPTLNHPPTDTVYWVKFIDGLQFEGAYSSSVSYQKNDIVTYGGRSYVAKQTTSGLAPTVGAYWALFSDGIAVKGSWSSTTAYVPNDIVTVGGRAFLALAASTNVVPGEVGSSASWQIFTDGVNYAGNWTTAVTYRKNDIVQRGGNTYIATSTHTAAATFNADLTLNKWTLYSGGMRWRGAWTPETSYLYNDLVTDGSSTYISNADFTSGVTTIIDDAYWTTVAAGADYLPAQNSNANKLLTTDGSDPVWTNTPSVLTISTSGFPNYFGPSAAATGANLTNPLAVFKMDTDAVTGPGQGSYAQLTVVNAADVGTEASTDIIAQADAGDDDNGWIDMGITNTSFDSTTYGITGPHDGYIFMSAPVGTTGNGNLVLATSDTGAHNNIVFAAGGLTSANTQMTIVPDTKVAIAIATASTSATTGALTVAGGVGISGNLNVLGDFKVSGNMTLENLSFIGVGTGAATFAATLTNPIAVFQSAAASNYSQLAFRNTGNSTTSSTDIIAYANNGADQSGYIDMGVTSSTFSDPLFTLTGAHDGYIFTEAPIGSAGAGNLVLATGSTGTENKIILAAGGLTTGNEQLVITPNQQVKINIATDSTSATTGALVVAGGLGITGSMFVNGNADIQGNLSLQGTISVAGAGTTFQTANVAVVDPMIYVASTNSGNAVDFAFVGESAHPLPSTLTATITNKSLTGDVAQLTTSAAHSFKVNDYVEVTGVDATFNGTHRILAVTVTSPHRFSFAKVAANVAAASATGTATVTNRGTYSGFAKDATDGVWKLFANATTKPTTTVDFDEVGLVYGDLKLRHLTTTGNIAVAGTLQVAGSSVVTEAIANAKGDIIAATGVDVLSRVAVGADNTFLMASSAATAGVTYTSLATGNVLGAVTVSTSTTRPAQPAAGQVIVETDTSNLSMYSGTKWISHGTTFLGFNVNSSGELIAEVDAEGTFSASSYINYTILPSEMVPSINASGQLVLTA